ncbi:hypothetical protein HNO89_003389 [Sporosarcina luteola]|nr:hypothetical protein [Sporosarcina luteola]
MGQMIEKSFEVIDKTGVIDKLRKVTDDDRLNARILHINDIT